MSPTLEIPPELATDVEILHVRGEGALQRCVIHKRDGKQCDGQPVILVGADGKKIAICRTCCQQLGPALLAIGAG